jgi:hypothetical protein
MESSAAIGLSLTQELHLSLQGRLWEANRITVTMQFREGTSIEI